jgi:hypothetical protein
MSQQIAPFSISAPGFMGVNKQDAPVDLASTFALEAINCVIDKSGRIASRKGWATTHTANSDLSTSNITCIGELILNDGTSTTLAAGGGYLFKLSGTTLVTLTYGGGGVAPTISANNWLFTQLNGMAVFFQRGYDPLIYDPAVSTTTFRRLSEHASYSGTVLQANAATSAYGRVWCADTTTDKNTIKWSDVITLQKWTGGSAGSLDLIGVWPLGGDEIVALATHNNFLVIFGRKQILLYSGASTPSTMALSDSIIGIGCIARDSVQNTGEDIIFLSNDGVRSLMRTIQGGSSPMRNVSKNVNDDVITYSSLETLDNVKSCYSRVNQFYLLTFPASSITYCFDLRYPLQDGSSRTTTWTDINPKALYETKAGTLYLGKASNLAKYHSYTDNSSTYRMSYFTTWIDFGNPMQTSIFKKAILTLIGFQTQTVVFKWAYDFSVNYFSQTQTLSGVNTVAEYGIAEYGIDEYSGSVSVNTLSSYGSGSGRVLQFGIETEINGFNLSVQRIDLYTKNGRLQ